MRSPKYIVSAGVLAAALGLAPAGAFAQAGSTTGQDQSTTGTAQPSTSTTGQSTTTQQGSSAVDQNAARQHLSNARQALADITKLPATAQVQGEARTQLANLISAFNAFATATTDWRSKYEIVDQQLNQLIGSDASAASSVSSATPPSTTGTTAGTNGTTAGTTGTATASGSTAANGAAGTTASAGGTAALDPAITAKLHEVRTELDAFIEATGDPTSHIAAIEKILDQAAGGTSTSAVGTSGTSGDSTASSAGGSSVTLTRAQIDQIRTHLEKIKAVAAK